MYDMFTNLEKEFTAIGYSFEEEALEKLKYRREYCLKPVHFLAKMLHPHSVVQNFK